jgi:hypothetical protein
MTPYALISAAVALTASGLSTGAKAAGVDDLLRADRPLLVVMSGPQLGAGLRTAELIEVREIGPERTVRRRCVMCGERRIYTPPAAER